MKVKLLNNGNKVLLKIENVECKKTSKIQQVKRESVAFCPDICR